MRFGLDLCAEEKVYLQQRKPKVLAGLSAFLGNKDDNPQSLSEVQTLYSRVSNKRGGTIINFHEIFHPTRSYSIPYVY